ncbi:ATP-binding protein [Actinomadura sp. 9N215]|uniref:ATP-binding protein n=1 Tax=Actinomadura sp. 9N215 TaxID=3375150 RepID=UPI0037BC1BDD
MSDSGTGDRQLDLAGARSLAASVQRLLRAAGEQVEEANARSPLVTRLTDHLGCPFPDVLTVEQTYRIWEHASLQRGIDAYLAGHSPDAEWFGISGADRRFESLDSMLTGALRTGGFQLGRPDYATAATGAAETMEVVELGLVTTAGPDGTPIVVGMQSTAAYDEQCVLTVFAKERATARAVRDEVDRLKDEHDVLRGRFVSFTASEHNENELVTFLPRQGPAATDVILPDGRLEGIESHIVGIAEHAERLLAAGQHLKRGLLLHGPPGVGKTHTVRYLIGRLSGYTVVQLTGHAVRFLDQAVALARRLQPAVIVLEDVDLVAEGRESHDSSPLLFSLLDAMDGLAEDANVVMVLTTNRVNVLERALTERPGRVDLAVEIPRPDAAGRLRLLRLYARDLRIEADLDRMVTATEGVTASFIKEMLRRAVLTALREAETVEALTDAHFEAALAGMTAPGQSLTPGLLGAPLDDPDDLRHEDDS